MGKRDLKRICKSKITKNKNVETWREKKKGGKERREGGLRPKEKRKKDKGRREKWGMSVICKEKKKEKKIM